MESHTIADHFLSHFHHAVLNADRREPRESRSDPQIQVHPRFYRICLPHVEVVRLATCLVDLSVRPVS